MSEPVFEEAGQGDFSVRYPHRRIIFDQQTEYQRVTLVDTLAFGRALFLDSVLNSTAADEFVYHEGIVHPAMLRARRRARVLIIGGAEGGTAREVLRYPEVDQLVMVDIDQELVELCQHYLSDIYGDPWSDQRMELRFEDGRRFVERSASFDVIILDLNEARDGGPAQRLFTRQFYEAVLRCLAPGGVAAVQSEWIVSRFHRQLTATHAAVFGGVRPQEVSIPSFLIGQAFNLGARDAVQLERRPEDIDAAIAARGLDLRYYNGDIDRRIGTLAPYQLAAYESEQEIFCDSNLPVYDFSN